MSLGGDAKAVYRYVLTIFMRCYNKLIKFGDKIIIQRIDEHDMQERVLVNHFLKIFKDLLIQRLMLSNITANIGGLWIIWVSRYVKDDQLDSRILCIV